MKEALERIGGVGSYKEAANQLVEEAIAVTGSTIGYFAELNDAEDELTMIGWSNSAMSMCAMIDKPIIYPLEQTGLWGDCIRERRPAITNDYATSTRPTKKGYPDGHVNVVRHMNVPVREGSHLRGILGVGNAPRDYDDEAAAKLLALSEKAWPILKGKRG